MDAKHCAGCRDDFYNHNRMGLNVDEGEPRCWSLRTAKLIMRKRVGINDRPPWDREPERLPNCYRQKGFVFVEPRVTR